MKFWFYFLVLMCLRFNAFSQGLPDVFSKGPIEFEYRSELRNHTSLYPSNTVDSLTNAVEDSCFLDKYWQKLNRNRKIKFYPLLSFFGASEFPTKVGSRSYDYGLAVSGKLHDKFSFSIIANRYDHFLPSFIKQSPFNRQTIPGIGLAQIRNKNQIADLVLGNFSWQTGKYISVSGGKGKCFIGEGYRSLLLSDNAPAYPYLTIHTHFWKVKYSNLYAWHRDYNQGVLNKKFMASHLLNWKITKKLTLGLYETVIWQGKDSLYNRGMDIAYLNPFIFYRSVEYSLGSADNSLMGANLKLQLKKTVMYGQLILDEFNLVEIRKMDNWWANKFGFQAGIKAFDFLGIQGWFIRCEGNFIRPFTYSHYASIQNYGHDGHSLAHPAGANLKELVIQQHLTKSKWSITNTSTFLAQGRDSSATSQGGNIFVSYKDRDREYGHFTGQGENHRIFFNRFCLAYRLSTATNMQLFGEWMQRIEQVNDINYASSFFQFGFRTSLFNQYYDY